MKRTLLTMLCVVVISLSVLHGVNIVKPKSLTPYDKEDIGYINVKKDLSVIAQSPHPTSSPRQEEVREYLRNIINNMGYTVEEQYFSYTVSEMVNRQKKLYEDLNEHQRLAFDAELARVGSAGDFEKEVRIRSGLAVGEVGYGTNLIVSRQFSGAKGTILFMAHYDSVGTSPGASDNGMAVASILQLMRDILDWKTSKNNVIFLLTDGEELGLFGAKHFVKELSPQGREAISLVINFEARGNRGIPLLFETSNYNHRLLNLLNERVSNIIAFSFTPLIYNMLQNDTDFTIFKSTGMVGLNFAVIEGFEHYHHMSDTIDNIPEATLFGYQNMIRTLGQAILSDGDIYEISTDNKAIYFPLPTGKLLIMPLMFSLYMGLMLLVLCILWGGDIFRRGKGSFFKLSMVAFLGLSVLWISYFLPTLSWLVSIPFIFFVSGIVFSYYYRWISFFIIFIGCYVTGVIYSPIIYLIFNGLKFTLLAGLAALVPLFIWTVSISMVKNS